MPIIRWSPIPAPFPLPTLKYGPAFAQFMTAIQGPEFTRAVERKLGVDLKGRPTMVTARGVSAARDGQIHTDSRTKLITVLIYMNNAWEAKTGRLRLLRGPDNLEDVIAEVPPDEGTLLIFKNEPNAWHGFHAFEGPRRVIQLNWVTDQGVVWREQTRHKVSAFFKRLRGKGPGSDRTRCRQPADRSCQQYPRNRGCDGRLPSSPHSRNPAPPCR